MHPGQINPYKLGFELWKDIEDRWNKGKFGKDYDDCDDYVANGNGTRMSGWAGRKSSRRVAFTTTSRSSTRSSPKNSATSTSFSFTSTTPNAVFTKSRIAIGRA